VEEEKHKEVCIRYANHGRVNHKTRAELINKRYGKTRCLSDDEFFVDVVNSSNRVDIYPFI